MSTKTSTCLAQVVERAVQLRVAADAVAGDVSQQLAAVRQRIGRVLQAPGTTGRWVSAYCCCPRQTDQKCKSGWCADAMPSWRQRQQRPCAEQPAALPAAPLLVTFPCCPCRPREPHLAGGGVEERALRLGAAVGGARLLDQIDQRLAELGLDQGLPAAACWCRKGGLGGARRSPSPLPLRPSRACEPAPAGAPKIA